MPLNTVRVYASKAGREPFSEWLEDLRDRSAIRRVHVRLRRLEQGSLGDHRWLGGGIGELRLDFGPGYRIYFAQEAQAIILLLAGGDKSTQHRDIRMAAEYWADYRERRP